MTRSEGGKKIQVGMEEETRIQTQNTGKRENRMTFRSCNELKQMDARNRPTIISAILC